MKNGETITWPAPAAGNQAASTTSWHNPIPQSRNPNPQQTPPDVVYANPATPLAEPNVTAIPSSSSVPVVSELPNQPRQQTPMQVNATVAAQGGQNRNQSTSHKDPFNSLMTSDQDRMKAALDRIAQEYRRVAGDKARLSVGSPNIPNNSDYIKVMRHDLPVLAEPNFGAQNLTILGLAQEGEYLPVLQEIESTYTLNNPLSSTPNNGGKWCQVRISSGESGWVMVEPVGMGSTSLAQIVRRPQPQPVGNGNQDYGAVIGLFIVVGIIVLFVKLTRSGGSGSSSSYSGGGTTHSSDSDSSYDYESSSGGSDSGTATPDEDENTNESKTVDTDKEDHGSKCDIEFDVRIVDEDGDGREDITVEVRYHTLLPIVPREAESTDKDGWAHFSNASLDSAIMCSFSVSIYADGELQADGISVEDGDTFSYTLPRS